MRGNGMLNERGTGAILAVCLISLALWMGLFLLKVSETERDISLEFIGGIRAQQLAESGALDAIERLRRDPNFAGGADSPIAEGSPVIQSSKTLFSEGQYKVYIKDLPDQCVVLSIGEVTSARRQIVVYVKRAKDDQPFTVTRWNNE